MNYYNEGSFVAKTMEDLVKLVAILNDADLSPYGYDPDDAYETDSKFCLEIGERYGDIKAQMDEVADKIIILEMQRAHTSCMTGCMNALAKTLTISDRWMTRIC